MYSARERYMHMDLRYTTALRNATRAWANQRAVDAVTLQTLQQPRYAHPHTRAAQAAAAPEPKPADDMQPQLARYGKLGTQLNIFA